MADIHAKYTGPDGREYDSVQGWTLASPPKTPEDISTLVAELRRQWLDPRFFALIDPPAMIRRIISEMRRLGITIPSDFPHLTEGRHRRETFDAFHTALDRIDELLEVRGLLSDDRAEQVMAAATVRPVVVDSPAPRVDVDVGTLSVTLDDERFNLDSEQAARWLAVLAAKPGAWFSSVDLTDMDAELIDVRTDRLKKKLPPRIRELVETKPGTGSRLKLA